MCQGREKSQEEVLGVEKRFIGFRGLLLPFAAFCCFCCWSVPACAWTGSWTRVNLATAVDHSFPSPSHFIPWNWPQSTCYLTILPSAMHHHHHHHPISFHPNPSPLHAVLGFPFPCPVVPLAHTLSCDHLGLGGIHRGAASYGTNCRNGTENETHNLP